MSPTWVEQSRVYAGQLYQFESEIVVEGYVYIDGENMFIPQPHSLRESFWRSEKLDEDVQQMNDIFGDHKIILRHWCIIKRSQEVGLRTAAV
jgi:hypothetical protein